MGSGSTLIACQRCNRKARLMEIDPGYADVIIRRWQEYTGERATLAGDGRTYDSVAIDRLGIRDQAEKPAAADAGRAEEAEERC